MEAASVQCSEQDLGLVTGGLLALVKEKKKKEKKRIDTLLYEHMKPYNYLSAIISFLVESVIDKDLRLVEGRSTGTQSSAGSEGQPLRLPLRRRSSCKHLTLTSSLTLTFIHLHLSNLK